MDRELTQDDLNEVEEICYNDGYEIDDIQEAMETLSDELKAEMSKDYEPDILAGVKFIEYQINYKRDNYEYDIEKEIEPIDTGMPEDCSFYEAKQYLNSRGYILVEATKEETCYMVAKNRMKKDFQKYVPELKEVNGKIDAKSFQEWMSTKLKRKINFHTSPKGELFWELTNKEYQKNYIYYSIVAYNIKIDYFGRNYDKVKIVINSDKNKNVFDTSCWDKNIRAYRASVAEDANPDMVKLATIVMRAYNKVPKYVQAGNIFKSRIMQVEPDGEWHKIGSTLDIDAIEEMGHNLKRESELSNVNVETGKKGFPSVDISFNLWNYNVEIKAMVGPMYCSCEMKVTK